jgi:hypothetical protein
VVDLDPATEQLKAHASQVLSGDQLTAFMAVADATRFAGDDGNIDADKVSGHLRTLFGVDEQPQQPPKRWGQHSAAGGPGKQPGDDGRAALEKRYGSKRASGEPPAGAQIPRGQSARAELAKRYGSKK